ncbi:MAG: hypothetical protein AAFQ95_08370 [Cyanobacteria bacterium J06621_3]
MPITVEDKFVRPQPDQYRVPSQASILAVSNPALQRSPTCNNGR